MLVDVTLREGAQSAHVALSTEAKQQVACAVAELGVRAIQIGFPGYSPQEEADCRAVAAALEPYDEVRLHCLCRPRPEEFALARDIGAAALSFSIPSSETALKRLGWDDRQLGDWVSRRVDEAWATGLTVRVSCENAADTPVERARFVYQRAVAAGAAIVTVADTVGRLLPAEVGERVRRLLEGTHVTVAVHCHDDLGLATANTLAAYEAGASHLEVSLCGIGERAGLAALEQVATALWLRYGVDTGVQLDRIVPAAERLYALLRLPRPMHRPIVGLNAFAHEIDIHTEALDDYSAFPPALVGARALVSYGTHTGAEGVRALATTLGVQLDVRAELHLVSRIHRDAHAGRPVGQQLVSGWILDAAAAEAAAATA